MRTTMPVSARRGAMLPLVALLLPAMLIIACFVVNVAYMELTRTELRIASDAATRAAGREFINTGSPGQARQMAKEAMQRNRAAGVETELTGQDVVFGVSRRTSLANRYNFTPGVQSANSVQVIARRDAKSRSGAVSMLMPTFGAVKQFEPTQSAISTQVELDVALVLDRSGSMAYGDYENSYARAVAGLGPEVAPKGWDFCDPAPKKSRWRDLVDGVDIFLKLFEKSPQEEYVALVTYGDNASRESNLSKSYGAVSAGMDVYSQQMCLGLTNIHAGITEGINAVADPAYCRPWAAKAIILMTDGKRTAGSNPTSAARTAFKQGIAVYTITFSAEADVSDMKSVADVGGGKHFHASSGAELQDAFREIAKSLPMLLTQ